MSTKVCTGCPENGEQPLSNFYRNAKSKDGRQTKCKACQKNYQAEHRVEARARSQEWRRRKGVPSKVRSGSVSGGIGTLFPDLTINIRASVMRIDSMIPLGPDRVAVEFRGVGVKGEPEAERRSRTDDHNQFWGPFGRNLPEDAIASVAQMRSMREGASRYSIIARDEKGAPAMNEAPMRAYYAEWSRLMGRPYHDPFNHG